MSNEDDIKRLREEVEHLRRRVKQLGGYPPAVEVFVSQVLTHGDSVASTERLYGHCSNWCEYTGAESPKTLTIVGRNLKKAGYKTARISVNGETKRAWRVGKEWA